MSEEYQKYQDLGEALYGLSEPISPIPTSEAGVAVSEAVHIYQALLTCSTASLTERIFIWSGMRPSF
ncbi:hypothetical protein M404DRAFT_995855 [Pisolithus tinctorius Marx 270]|uniref:Uncharacterized protein n=1 Tax=Pisolithus tinctorius Marx 270 TaxID=870435 RepID=A0A0C3PM61_PISTI|nr:hypothetical protein M404DRAFT_995855 [Pisolithus tinctorius Marx 270]